MLSGAKQSTQFTHFFSVFISNLFENLAHKSKITACILFSQREIWSEIKFNSQTIVEKSPVVLHSQNTFFYDVWTNGITYAKKMSKIAFEFVKWKENISLKIEHTEMETHDQLQYLPCSKKRSEYSLFTCLLVWHKQRYYTKYQYRLNANETFIIFHRIQRNCLQFW